MNKNDLYNLHDQDVEFVVSFVNELEMKKDKEKLNGIRCVLKSSNSSNRYLLLSLSDDKLFKSVFMALLFTSADPLMAQTIFFKRFVEFLKEVCEGVDVDAHCLVPINDVEEELISFY